MSISRSSNLVSQLFEHQTSNNVDKFRSNLYRERLATARNLYKYDLVGHYGCVNAIEFSNGGEILVSGGDDKRVLLWNLEKSMLGKSQPHVMDREHQSNIFCVSFNRDNSKIFSGGNDDAVIIHDTITGSVRDVFLHAKPVYGLSVDQTQDNILATAGEDGHVLLFDQRSSSVILTLGKYRRPFHAVQFHPQDGNFLVTANSKKGAAFWDIRKSQYPVINYGGEENPQSCMSIRLNTLGSQALVLRRRLPPILYNTFSQDPVCQFYHPDYYNSCTMKSCSFAGEDDEFVMSGSDDFNLYMWHVGEVESDMTNQWIENTHMVLYGHRSIVNQVRYNSQKCLIASSGVEKIIKLWSPFEQKKWAGSITEEKYDAENQRDVFSHDAYYSLIHLNWSEMTHDYSNQNTHEDPRMMAFFDSLIQQEIEAWHSNNTTDSDDRSASSENSVRQNSTESSDEEDRHRRGVQYTNNKPQRTRFPNRIAYLIATKRNKLRRLALKGSLQMKHRKPCMQKCMKRRRPPHLSAPRGKFSGKFAKRYSRYSTTSSRQRAEAELIKNSRYRHIQEDLQHFRRQYRNHHVNGRYQSDSEEEDAPPAEQDGRNPPNGFNNSGTSSSSSGIAIPSTSTGITRSGKHLAYCLRQESDSEDDNSHSDNEAVTLVRPSIVPQRAPIPQLNGFHNHTNTNASEPHSSDTEENRYTTNNRKRPTGTVDLDIYSSHSNSRLSNSSYQEHDSTSNESLDCFRKRQKIVPINNSSNNNESNNTSNQCDSANNNEMTEATTPNGNFKCNHSINSTPDSGISNNMAGCSSSSGSITSQVVSSSNNNSSNVLNEVNCNSDKFAIKLFHQKVARVRRNYRKKFGDDSESD